MPTLDWIGKKAVVNHHREVPFRLLKCDRELSVGDPGSGNLLVQGDNLFALKAPLPHYAGDAIRLVIRSRPATVSRPLIRRTCLPTMDGLTLPSTERAGAWRSRVFRPK